MTLFSSAIQLIQHAKNYTQPELQKPVIRILLMVPIYSLDSWLALKFPNTSIYVDTCRECYEAYLIYNFMAYLYNYLKYQYPYLTSLLENKEQMNHYPPFCFCPPWTAGEVLVYRCRLGVLQYTVIKILTTLTALICETLNIYGEGKFSFSNSWTYLIIISNFSQLYAMYCLLIFYKAVREELAPIKPIGKFVCVKMVVFVTFWQSIIIALLVRFGIISKTHFWGWEGAEEVATGLQDFLICIEMFFASLAHHFLFTYKVYVTLKENTSVLNSFFDVWDISDLKDDISQQIKHTGSMLIGCLRPKHPKFEEKNRSRFMTLPSPDTVSTPSSPDTASAPSYNPSSPMRRLERFQSTTPSKIRNHPGIPTELDTDIPEDDSNETSGSSWSSNN